MSRSIDIEQQDLPEDEQQGKTRYNDDEAEDAEDTAGSVTLGSDSPLIASSDLDTPLPHPRWLQPRRRWQVPQSFRKIASTIVTWTKGPEPPQIQKIQPWFPSIQEAPIRLLDRYAPKKKHKFLLLVTFFVAWFMCFAMVLRKSAFATEIKGYGTQNHISCTATYWAAGNGCGINGNNCRPFDNATFAFRCPANCKTTRQVNPHAVGDQEVIYKPLVIGGPPADAPSDGIATDAIYRGDSFICGSGIHAGFVSDSQGGCGVLVLVGKRSFYPPSKRHGISSVGFDSSFPLAYTFVPGTETQCRDLRWPLLGVSLVFTTILSLFTTSTSVFVYSEFLMLYAHVGLGSDPPLIGDYYAIVSILLGRFLPAMFCVFVFHKYCMKPTLFGLTAQVEKTILWIGGAWIGSLTNYTFDFIPIQRLTPHDIKQQPGAVLALILVLLLLLSIALGQIYYLRLEGRLPRYLGLYALMASILIIGLATPKMNLRIHHYILAIIFLPGTGIQTRPSLLYQGILLGFFVNGIARWGFDSILQTPAELLGDGQLDTLLPSVTAVAVSASNISFAWAAPPQPDYDGVSILVNDVEQYRGYKGYDAMGFTWLREAGDELSYYFRFGYMSGSSVGDYTKAGKWTADGTWIPMEVGPSFTIADSDGSVAVVADVPTVSTKEA